MVSARQLEQEVQDLMSEARPIRVPVNVPVREVEAYLSDVERSGGPVRVKLSRAGIWGGTYANYAQAEPWEVIALLGPRDVAEVLCQSDPMGFARWRAGGWKRKDLAKSSAYERLAVLAAAGRMPWAPAR